MLLRVYLLTVLLVCLSVMSIAPAAAIAPAAVIAPTVTLFLSQLNDAVSARMLQAQHAGDALMMHAGAQLQLVIDSVKVAFADCGQVLISEVDVAVKNRLDQIQSISNNFVHSLDDSSSRILREAQTISNSLPFSNKQPQVQFSSTVVELSANTVHWPQAITFSGNWLEKGRLHVHDTTGGEREITPPFSSTNRLRFSLPLADMFDPPPTDSHELKVVQAKLVVRYSRGWLEWFSTESSVEYQVQIVGVYSDSVGRIEVVHTLQGKKTVEQGFCSGNFHVASTREAGNHDQIDKHDQYVAPAGWTIVPGTVHIPPPTYQGDCTLPQIVSQDVHQVTAKCTTVHHGFGSSGSIDYVICGRITQLVDETPHDHSEQVVLQRGERSISAIPANSQSWKVVYHGPDGKRVEFGRGSPDDNRFILVTSDSSTISITAKQPRALEHL